MELIASICFGSDIYSMKWQIECIAPRYRDLMERQVCIHLSGGISEEILCGVRGGREALRFADSAWVWTWPRRVIHC